jgi:hypothetical protein
MWRERTRAAEMIKTVHKLKRVQEDWAYYCGVVSLDRARGDPERAMGIQNISVVGSSRFKQFICTIWISSRELFNVGA